MAKESGMLSGKQRLVELSKELWTVGKDGYLHTWGALSVPHENAIPMKVGLLSTVPAKSPA